MSKEALSSAFANDATCNGVCPYVNVRKRKGEEQSDKESEKRNRKEK